VERILFDHAAVDEDRSLKELPVVFYSLLVGECERHLF
jgi:hypothetical protein